MRISLNSIFPSERNCFLLFLLSSYHPPLYFPLFIFSSCNTFFFFFCLISQLFSLSLSYDFSMFIFSLFLFLVSTSFLYIYVYLVSIKSMCSGYDIKLHPVLRLQFRNSVECKVNSSFAITSRSTLTWRDPTC